jgi:hypothetical protein
MTARIAIFAKTDAPVENRLLTEVREKLKGEGEREERFLYPQECESP